ncbi:diacylglycerol kinase family protein [Deinococcus sp. QL22]|uniref:diacylglycerol/lipid kinase family protein n=1 Tax=Deinococcus sp. QL22 TaxID=2939437 RepID=UPI002016DC32|nr:diacylglycerol kinase family protein [Deinococcus sp. QL22]UQN05051.1 diacylglycerol kinase family lipid kinase [Deinococcus sp. QL22]
MTLHPVPHTVGVPAQPHQAQAQARAPSQAQSQSTEATLIYNTRAGSSERASPDHLVEELAAIGYRPIYRATASADDIAHALQGARGTIFVAGGDGTLRAVALHLLACPEEERAALKVGVIPMGTANNVARTLGVLGDPLEVIRAYAGAQAVPFDVGRVRGPWGHDLFLEACGCGLFADVMAEYGPDDGKSVLRAVQAMIRAMPGFAPPTVSLTLDGRAFPDDAYTILEVMNTSATGPTLRFSTHADPTEGTLDVIRVAHSDRESMLAYLTSLLTDTFEDRPSVQSHDARVTEISYVGQIFHVDGETRQADPGGRVRIEAWPGALQMLRPQRQP